MPSKKKKTPKPSETFRATKVLDQTRDSVKGFLSAYDASRQARKAKGAATDEEQDLLRAALVFSAAGLDSVVKELIKGSMSALAPTDDDVRAELEVFVQRQLRGDSDDHDLVGGRKFLAQVILAPEPLEKVLDGYVEDLTGSSLQSASQLIKAAKALGLKPEDIGIHATKLRPIFNARNKMIHELDVNLEKTAARRNQNSRRRHTMEEWANELLDIAQSMVDGVNKKIVSAA